VEDEASLEECRCSWRDLTRILIANASSPVPIRAACSVKAGYGVSTVFLDRETRLFKADAVVSDNRGGAAGATEHLQAFGMTPEGTPGNKVTVIGEALIDLVSGDSPLTYTARPGGSPHNVAIGLARL
jgi:hypothetical protein